MSEWQQYYNWERPHSSLGGKSPEERRYELSAQTPFWYEVEENYYPEKEQFQAQNYYDDLRLFRIWRRGR